MKRNKYLLKLLGFAAAFSALAFFCAGCSNTGFSGLVHNTDSELENDVETESNPGDMEEAASETADNYPDGDADSENDTNCSAGGKMCVLNIAYACQNGDWQKRFDCANFGAVCLNGDCKGGDYEPAEEPEYESDAEIDSPVEEQSQCTVGDKRCIGATVYICNQQGNYDAQMDCASVGKTCSNGTCYGGGDLDPDPDPEPSDVDTAACSQGQTKCVGSTVFRCDSSGTWGSVENCANSGKSCANGACVGGGDVDTDADSNPGGLCPSGQACVQGSTQSGVTICLASNGSIPPENKTGCDTSSATSCPHNQWCVAVGSTNYCIQLCGACPSGQTCATTQQINYCSENGGIPGNAQRGCSSNQPCTGNANCYCTEQTCAPANNVCLFNCSSDIEPPADGDIDSDADRPDADVPPTSCTNDQTCAPLGKSCVDGKCLAKTENGVCPSSSNFCVNTGNGAYKCLDVTLGKSGIPSNAVKNCSEQNGCEGNAICACADSQCTSTACVNLCGNCPQGQTCEDIANGYLGCLVNGNSPPGAKTGCGSATDCPANSTCWCNDQSCATTVCINNCSQ